MSSLQAAELANLLLAGLLAGNDLVSVGIVNPAITTLSAEAKLAVDKLIFKRYAIVMPVFIPATIASGAVVAALQEGGSTHFWLAIAGTAALVLWQIVAFSLFPINKLILRDDPSLTPERWRELHHTWSQRHLARAVLSFAAFVLFLVSALG
jgi:hypothetical protein